MIPVEFIESMHQQLGAEADLLIKALETEPVTSIRLNSKLDVLTFEGDTDEVPWHLDGYYLSIRPQFTLDPLFHAGCYYVQEASSMFIQQALEQYVDQVFRKEKLSSRRIHCCYIILSTEFKLSCLLCNHQF